MPVAVRLPDLTISMNDKVTYLTKDGLDKLKVELDELVRVRRKEIAARIQEAKELGDLSENAEYQEAKNEQAFNEGRIEELENTINHAELIPENTKGSRTARVGSTVKATQNGQPITFSIVGSNEADPLTGKISNESPLGQALLGKAVGEQVRVNTPKGEATYQITELS